MGIETSHYTQPRLEHYWRAVILFGRKCRGTATESGDIVAALI